MTMNLSNHSSFPLGNFRCYYDLCFSSLFLLFHVIFFFSPSIPSLTIYLSSSDNRKLCKFWTCDIHLSAEHSITFTFTGKGVTKLMSDIQKLLNNLRIEKTSSIHRYLKQEQFVLLFRESWKKFLDLSVISADSVASEIN